MKSAHHKSCKNNSEHLHRCKPCHRHYILSFYIKQYSYFTFHSFIHLVFICNCLNMSSPINLTFALLYVASTIAPTLFDPRELPYLTRRAVSGSSISLTTKCKYSAVSLENYVNVSKITSYILL